MKIKYPLLKYIRNSFMILAASITTIAVAGGLTKNNKNIFDITTQIFVDGNLISSPHIIARANQKACIVVADKRESSKNLTVNLIAKNNKNNIDIKFDVYYQDGKVKIHTKPRFILVNKQKGTMKITTNSNHLFEMRVCAERQ